MSSRPQSKTLLPSTVAEILEEFKSQRSATRPRIGVGNQNYFLYGQGAHLEDDTTIPGVRTRLTFDSSQTEVTETPNVLERSQASKRSSEGSTPTDYQPDSKRFASSPDTSSGLDWSFAHGESRSRLLETVDSKIQDLQKLVSKNEEFKRQIMEVMDQEKQIVQRQRQRERNIMKQLQEEVQTAKDKAFELEQELIKKKGRLRELKINSEQEIQQLKSEKADLNFQLREVRHELETIQLELGQQLEECQTELELTNNKCIDQEQRLSDMEAEVAAFRERDMQEKALKESLNIAQQRIQILEAELASLKATSQRQKEATHLSSATARRVKELEEQLAQSREMVRGKLLLEETMGTLRAQLASSSNLAEQLANQQEINKRKEAELAEWHTLATQLVSGSAGTASSPRALGARVQQLEQSNVVIRADLNEAVSQLTAARQAKADAEAELKSEQGRCQSLHNTLETQTAIVKRLERKLQLITKERDSIQAVLTAYEGDVTLVGGQLNSMQRARMESAESSARELRAMLEEREKELAQLKGSPGDPSGALASVQEKLQARQQELDKEQAKLVALEERCERLELLLEQRALRGDYDPSQTKILHFKMNPQAIEAAKRSQEFQQLREANDKLRERVRVLETAGASGSAVLNTTTLVEANLQMQSNKELVDLRDKVKQLETKSQRLVECFKKTSTSFRQAIYLLFGYKTDALNENTYRLTSLYSEREDDHLLFKIVEGDSIEMVQTAFSDTLSELIATHLQDQGSVPAFLSALTLDLFSRQTFTS